MEVFFIDEFKRDFKERFNIDYEDWKIIKSIIDKKDETISIKEAADFLGVSVETIRNWDKNAILPSYKTAGGHRRYLVKDIAAFKEKQTPKQRFLIENGGERWIIRPYDYFPCKVSDLTNSGWWDTKVEKAFKEGAFNWFKDFEECLNLSAELRKRFIEKDKEISEIKENIKRRFNNGN